MKIKLTDQRRARVPYTHCPLCEGAQLVDLRTDDCTSHPLYRPELGSTIQWRGCEGCGHIFTSGYFDEAAFKNLLSRSNPAQLAGPETDAQRPVASRIVSRVSHVRGVLGGLWLDVGVGNGALLAAAEEFGYEVVGLEVRAAAAEALREYGYDVRQEELGSLNATELFDVISLADVLEHVPFPAELLTEAWKRMDVGGMLFVSMPNVDTFTWKALDRDGTNPYWAELEHYHNFSREHLYWLLRNNGFEPCEYAVSERYRACMEVIAVRMPELADAA
jgi:2-polyprenyl-3-methyl-5-hydroxy-6-metoxy-1,4-benzoquinol methylase